MYSTVQYFDFWLVLHSSVFVDRFIRETVKIWARNSICDGFTTLNNLLGVRKYWIGKCIRRFNILIPDSSCVFRCLQTVWWEKRWRKKRRFVNISRIMVRLVNKQDPSDKFQWQKRSTINFQVDRSSHMDSEDFWIPFSVRFQWFFTQRHKNLRKLHRVSFN